MPHNYDGTTSPPQFEKLTTKKEHPPPSPNLSEDSKVKEPHPKSELDENITNQPAKAASKEDNLKRLESLNERAQVLKYVSIVIYLSVFVLSFLSILTGILPDKVMDVELYSCLLISHSISFLALFIVHYQLIPRLLDERCTVSSKIQGLMPFPPAYHRSKDELFWCYMRIFLAISTDAVIWIYLNYIHVQYGNSRSPSVLIRSALSGVLISFISFCVMAKIGPSSSEAILEQQREEQREDATVGVGENARYYNLLKEKDRILVELLNEKEYKIETLRKENQELNSKNERLTMEIKNS